jgi:hypothetical protein
MADSDVFLTATCYIFRDRFSGSRFVQKSVAHQCNTLTCGRGAHFTIKESRLPRSNTVHNNKSTALVLTDHHGDRNRASQLIIFCSPVVYD